jgi:hypothetical protein
MPPVPREDAERVPLSSRLTFFYKLVFPTLWLGGFAIATVVLAVSPASEAHDAPSPLAFLAFLAGGAFLFWRCCLPLRRVVATRTGLLVSSYGREAFVPYPQIASARQNKLLAMGAWGPITVTLLSPGPWGSRIVFVPPFNLDWLEDNPAAVELTRRMAAARERD